MVFAGYVATPLFLSGLGRFTRWSGCVRWSARWRCFTRLPAVSRYSELPEYQQRGRTSFSSSTLAIGVLVLEVLLALPLYYGATVIVCSRKFFCAACWRKCQQCSISSRFSFDDRTFARYDGVASLSKSLLRRCATVRVNHYLNAHHAEISSFFISLALMLAVPFAPQAVAKTAALPPRHNRKLPPVAR